MGLNVLGKDRFHKMAVNYFMKDQVNNLSKIMDYCLKYPEVFTKAFNETIPQYKRDAIINLMNKAKEEA